MTKLSTQDSGIHIEPFFRTHKLSGFELEKNLGEKYYIEIPDFIIQDEAKGNYDVEDFHNDEEEMLWEVKNNLICSGLLSKWEWLAFVGKNGLKLNDFINSPWLDLIDTENITAHIKWFYPLSWLTLFDSIKLTSS